MLRTSPPRSLACTQRTCPAPTCICTHLIALGRNGMLASTEMVHFGCNHDCHRQPGGSQMKVARAAILFAFLLTPVICALTAYTQTSQNPAAPPDEKSKEEAEQGIPVTSRLVIDKC